MLKSKKAKNDLHANNMKNRFLAASAYLQNFHAYSRLAYLAMVACSAPHSLKNFEELSCQTSDFSYCLCIL
jgi:hypothetical protein